MSNSYIGNFKQFNEGGTYGQNLWHAFQILLAALLDVKAVSKQMPHASEKDREKSINEIYKLAKQFDATMPNQAAELRYLACKDGA